MTCPDCGVAIEGSPLACPTCHALLHRDRLRELAQAAEAAGTGSDALVAWREALDLLPPGSRQRELVQAKIEALSQGLDAPAPPPPRTWGGGWTGGALGAGLLLLWKGKALVVFAATKLKFLALGFSKLSTVLSMLASMGLYATLWGWKFALGFVLAIYVHEIGHVAALRRFGIAATAPMFIPGFGAVVRLKQYPATAREDARVGIAGPVWGAGASVAAWAVGIAAESPLFLAIAATSASINLFNLLPVWQLDGGRAFRGMTRWQRGGAAALMLVAWGFTDSPMSFIVGLVMAGIAAFRKDAPEKGDVETTVWFCVLAVGLSLLGGVEALPSP